MRKPYAGPLLLLLSAFADGCVCALGYTTMSCVVLSVCAWILLPIRWMARPSDCLFVAGTHIGILVTGALTRLSYRFRLSWDRRINLQFEESMVSESDLIGDEGDLRAGKSARPISGRQRSRLGYLLRKTALRVARFGAATVAVCCALELCGGWFGNNVAYFIPAAFIVGFIYSLSARLYRTSTSMSVSLPEVPPVRDQIASLPAAEVLLRSSNLPTMVSGALLRPAAAGIPGPAELPLASIRGGGCCE
jgi:hypothetical protein